MADLQREIIEQLFAELGDELARRFKTPVKIMLIGGAYMLLTQQNRETTQDVDIFPLNIPNLSDQTRESKQFRAGVKAIARRHGYRGDWLNGVAFDMIGGLGPDPQLTLWKQYNILEVYIPPEEYILALKIFAYREKDMQDIATLLTKLHIVERKQLQDILDMYIY